MKKQQLKMDLLVIEDALETHSQTCGLGYDETYGKNFSRLKSLLEKLAERDTPKKVEIGTSKSFKFPICPNCKTELNEYYKDANKFCKECGQRLDWRK